MTDTQSYDPSALPLPPVAVTTSGLRRPATLSLGDPASAGDTTFFAGQSLSLPDHPDLVYEGQLPEGGGFGLVHKLYDRRQDRHLALKIPRRLADQRVQHSFRSEAQRLFKLMSQANHPNVVPPVCFVQPDGVPWLVMEFVPGGSLARLLQGRGGGRLAGGSQSPSSDLGSRGSSLDLAIERLAIALDIAAGMVFIHQRGMLHLDLKPANVLIDSRDVRARIIDFGLAQTAQTFQDLGRDPSYQVAFIDNITSPRDSR